MSRTSPRAIVRRSAFFVLAASGSALACGFEGAVLTSATSPDAATGPDVDTNTAEGSVEGTAFQVAAGQYSTCELVHGVALCWGSNTQGGLGTGDQQDRLSPTAVDSTSAFSMVSLGDLQACGLEAQTNGVDCWGANSFGQLGLGDTTSRSKPASVALAHGAIEVAAGYEFSCAILSDHSLWCWGENDEGQLGQNDVYRAPNSPIPLQTGSATSWMHVAGGQGHACGIQSPGVLWCWGRNTDGELGIGPGQPIQLRAPTQVGSDQDWATLDLGQGSTCAIKTGGTLWCWGDDGSNELGFPPSPDAGSLDVPAPTQVGVDANWAQVSIDTFHACAVKTDGTLWCWGRNQEGQLGLGDNASRSVPTQVGSESDWALVSVGRFHTCAQKTDHTVYCTGADNSGSLGVGDTTQRNQFTQALMPVQ
jgi:alpha-tubulin suppressor-like RCC1 family protein